jgi:hypothetical protein
LSYRKQEIDGTRWRVFHFLNLSSLSLDNWDLDQIASRKMLSFCPVGYIEVAQVVKRLSINGAALTWIADKGVVTQETGMVGLCPVEKPTKVIKETEPLVYGRSRFFTIPVVRDASRTVLQEEPVSRENTPV